MSIIADALAPKTRASGDIQSIFSEEPCDLRTFVEDARFLGNPALSDIQYDALYHLEQVYNRPDYEALCKDVWHIDPYRAINFAYLEWGKGSGKDHICRLATARIVYLLLCLNSPQEYYGKPRQDFIHTLNVASTAPQAYRAFFNPLRHLVSTAPCFKDKYEAKKGDMPGQGSILFDKHIEAVSGHSEAEQQEGLNLILGIADEISAFKTKEEAERHASRSGGREPAKTAESILKMIRTSARTRFPRTFKLVAISYPRFKNDAIQQLRKRAEKDNQARGKESRMYASGPYATWDVNPVIEGKEQFQEDYDEDPIMARAMYECDPDTAVSRFLRNDIAIATSFMDRRPDPVVVEYYWAKEELPEELTMQGGERVIEAQEGWQVRFHFSPDLVPYRGALYAMHGDLAINGDRAGVAMSHVRRYEEQQWNIKGGQGEIVEPRPIIKLDFGIAFEADIGADPIPREIQIRWMRKLVWELRARGFAIEYVTYDGFQSTDSIQILESWGLETDKLSMDRSPDPWNNLRDVLYDGRLEGYYNELLIDELKGLMRLGNGKVDHPPGGSKDIADAVCGSVEGAIYLGGDEGADPQRADEELGIDLFSVGGLGKGAGGFGGEDMGFPTENFGMAPDSFGTPGFFTDS